MDSASVTRADGVTISVTASQPAVGQGQEIWRVFTKNTADIAQMNPPVTITIAFSRVQLFTQFKFRYYWSGSNFSTRMVFSGSANGIGYETIREYNTAAVTGQYETILFDSPKTYSHLQIYIPSRTYQTGTVILSDASLKGYSNIS